MKQQLKRGFCAVLCACVILCAAPSVRAARFIDVPAGHWAAADIELCAQQGIMNGVSNTVFGLGIPLSRAACLVTLSRFFGWEPADPAQLPYRDINPSGWYASALAAAYREGAVTEQNLFFRPDDPVTRGEFTALLIRALGYQVLSGLTEPAAFSDLSANAGYITVAHDIGLVNGNQGRFAPNQSTSREQAAAILARLYRKLHASPLRKMGIVSSSDGLWSSAQLNAAAVQGGQLTGIQGDPIRYQLSAEEADSLRVSVASTGAQALLYLSGDTILWNALQGVANAVWSGNYAGLLLELTGSSLDFARIQSLRGLLQNRSLYLIVPAPEQTDDDYPYAALANLSDGLAIRVLGQSRLVNGFPTDPVEPLEEVYEALSTLFRADAPALDASRCFLLLSTTGSQWVGDVQTGLVRGTDVESMLREENVLNHYSERYACAYLRRTAGDDAPEEVVWYLDARAVSTRTRLARLFGVGGIILSDANGVSASFLSSL